MLILYNWELVWQSVTDTWLPIIVPFLVLSLIFIVIAIIRKEKNNKEKRKDKNEK